MFCLCHTIEKSLSSIWLVYLFSPRSFAVCLSNMNSEMVRKIFTLIYTGMVSIAPSMVNDFVAAARYLKLQGFDEIDADIDSDGFSNAERQPDLDRGFQIKLTRIDTVPPSVMNHGAHDMSPAMNALVSSTINPAANEQFFPSTDSSDTSGAEDMSSQNSGKIYFFFVETLRKIF